MGRKVLDEYRASLLTEDEDRDSTENDLVDEPEQLPATKREHELETNVPDIRDTVEHTDAPAVPVGRSSTPPRCPPTPARGCSCRGFFLCPGRL